MFIFFFRNSNGFLFLCLPVILLPLYRLNTLNQYVFREFNPLTRRIENRIDGEKYDFFARKITRRTEIPYFVNAIRASYVTETRDTSGELIKRTVDKLRREVLLLLLSCFRKNRTFRGKIRKGNTNLIVRIVDKIRQTGINVFRDCTTTVIHDVSITNETETKMLRY